MNLSTDLFINLFIHPLISIVASPDVHAVCPHVTMKSCPSITLESGETVQLIPKPVQPDLDLPTDLPIPDDVRRYYCTLPGSIYMQNPRNEVTRNKVEALFFRRFISPKFRTSEKNFFIGAYYVA